MDTSDFTRHKHGYGALICDRKTTSSLTIYNDGKANNSEQNKPANYFISNVFFIELNLIFGTLSFGPSIAELWCYFKGISTETSYRFAASFCSINDTVTLIDSQYS